MRLKRVVPLLVAVVVMTGCVAAQKELSPEQRLYAAKSEYLIWANNIVDLLIAHPELKGEYRDVFVKVEARIYELNKRVTLTVETMNILIKDIQNGIKELKDVYVKMTKKIGETK